MKNLELAKIFYNMAAHLEIKGGEPDFRTKAYEQAGRILETTSVDIDKLAKNDQLQTIPGIGKNIAAKIKEYLKTGKVDAYEKLKKQTPVKLEELIAIEGVGPQTVKILYKKLGIKNLKQLEKFAKAGKIRNLDGFGEKSEANIIKAIEFVKASQGRQLLGYILPLANGLLNKLFGCFS